MNAAKSAPKRPQTARFFSLRWRIVFPLMLITLVAAMAAGYTLGSQLSDDAALSADSVLLQSVESLNVRAVELFRRHRSEAQRIAYSAVVAVRSGDRSAIADSLTTLATLSELDGLVLMRADGEQLFSLLRSAQDDRQFSVDTAVYAANWSVVERMRGGNQTAVGLAQTPEGSMLFVGVPIIEQEIVTGYALAGYTLRDVLEHLQMSNSIDLLLYDADGNVLQTTVDAADVAVPAPEITTQALNQVLQGLIQLESVITAGQPDARAAYAPFVYGDSTVGIVALVLPDYLPMSVQAGKQAAGLFVAVVFAVVVMAGFLVANHVLRRIEHISATADALASGKTDARTGMTGSDELGVLGFNLDRFSVASQQKQDILQGHLRRERRERMYLVSVLESIPDGVVVQDKDGKLLLMNHHARTLLGRQKDLQAYLSQFIANDQPGERLVPGLYAIGDPQQIRQDGQMLRAQAAAVISPSGARIGTVLIIRDITAEVQQTQAREDLLAQLVEDIQQPLAGLAQHVGQDSSRIVTGFAQEIGRHAAALQKMIVEMRELTSYDQVIAEQIQRPLSADTLIIAVANDWRQIVQAARLELRVQRNTPGVMVLGDESRLRWALGNILDNAIKYTPSGGAVTLEINDVENGLLNLRVRDNGVGISDEDLPNVFMPFYRGTPAGADGRVIRVPGMGQGLPLARQIIQAHGGTLKIRSRVGVGTAVYVTLPVTSGSSYKLPLLPDEEMDGETVRLPAKNPLRRI
jgi:PAS domain S-box-containing protein